MSILALLLMIVGHFVGDWLLQSREIALAKSRHFPTLLKHLTRVQLTLIPFYFVADIGLLPSVLYITLHGLQDWYWWRYWGKRLDAETWFQQKTFYDAIALDQMLHLSLLAFIWWLSM